MSQDLMLLLEGLILFLHASARPSSLQRVNKSKMRNPRVVSRRGGAINVS